MNAPLVSVIMCAYNAGPYLGPAVQSVLEQTHRNLELLLVDDGSTDGSVDEVRDLLSDPRVRLIRQENRGKPAAMNVALAHARGEFYALNDADDLSYPTRIERQLAVLLARPELAAVFTGYDLILEGRRLAPVARAKDEEACRRDIEAFRMPGHDPTGMYRLGLVKTLHYEPSLPVVEGYDYILRVGERWPVVVMGECLYSYRFHARSVTKQSADRRRALVREVRRRARERRGITGEPPADAEGRWSRNRRREFGLAWHFMESACDLIRLGRRAEAVKVGLVCAGRHPLDPHYLKALVCSLVPARLIPRLRRGVV